MMNLIDLYELKCFVYKSNFAKEIIDEHNLFFEELGVSAQNPGGPYYISYYTLKKNYKYIIPDNIIKIYLRNKKLESL